jgi:hypothetical protein
MPVALSQSVVLHISDDDLPSRWALELRGDAIDLADAARLFARDAEVCIRIIPADPAVTVLSAREFESLSAAGDIHSAGDRIVDFLNGILFVQDPARKPVSIGGVRERRSNGQWGLAMIAASAQNHTAWCQSCRDGGWTDHTTAAGDRLDVGRTQ